MARSRKTRRLTCVFCIASVWTSAVTWGASTRVVRNTPSPSAALSAWERAQRGREILEAIPEPARTRADYTRALDLYRAIYHDAPAGSHAPASIFAVAELLAEQGHSLHDPHSFQTAAGQYRFLRTQYPMSSLVPAALFAEGQIEQIDLQDLATARERYMLLLKTHPKSAKAEAAREALATLRAGRPPFPSSNSDSPQEPADIAAPRRASAAVTPRQSMLPSMPTTGDPAHTPARDTIPASAVPSQTELPTALPAPLPTRQAAEKRKAAVVSGIRHWSTNDYTRVAIDLGDDVTYEAARVPHPDRIFFDLHGTKLAPELLGKTFAVTDEGFLHRIRAAQATSDTTRVVLDVSEVTEYSAFLLPNPYRLIIDIHGKGKVAGAAAGEDAGAFPSQPPARTADAPPGPTPVQPPPVKAQVPAPRVAQTQAATLARPVPNTVTLKSPETSSSELAALSQQPGKIDATAKPTSRPIAMTSIFAGGAVKPPSDTASKKRSKSRASALDNPDPGTPSRPAVPTAAGETSLVRALGLKIGRIVIDAGHGGHDSGTLGAGGIQEKDVVLDVALRLGKLLHERLGAEIIYTRSDDTFIPLETRTAIANKAQADLFLSIHANSSPDETARGVETYYLNFTSQSDALQVAARENAVSGSSIHELSNLVKKIALKDKIEESREFATDVEQSLYGGLATGNEGLKDRGVKKAPFVVLIGANMPSILAEISFVTNERDAAELRRPDYRQRVAESLFKGVAKYEVGLGEAQAPVEQASRR